MSAEPVIQIIQQPLLSSEVQAYVNELRKEIARQCDHIAELEAALIEYCQHSENCNIRDESFHRVQRQCTCGLTTTERKLLR